MMPRLSIQTGRLSPVLFFVTPHAPRRWSGDRGRDGGSRGSSWGSCEGFPPRGRPRAAGTPRATRRVPEQILRPLRVLSDPRGRPALGAGGWGLHEHVLGGTAVEAVRPDKQTHLSRRGRPGDVRRSRCAPTRRSRSEQIRPRRWRIRPRRSRPRARRDVASSGVPRAPLASHSLTTLTTLTAGKPFVGELQVRDVVYKTIVVKLPALVPGGLCAPPTRVACPCLVVLRADVQTLARCRGRGVILYLHGNGTDIGGAAEEAKTLARELDCHVVVPEYPGYGLAEGTPSEDSVDAVAHAAARFIEKTMGAPRDRVIIYGRSVGTGPAAAAAARLSRGAFSGLGGGRAFSEFRTARAIAIARLFLGRRPRRWRCIRRTRAYSISRGKKPGTC